MYRMVGYVDALFISARKKNFNLLGIGGCVYTHSEWDRPRTGREPLAMPTKQNVNAAAR